MHDIHLHESVLTTLREHAAAEFPNECCGIVIDRGAGLEVVKVTNLQDELHAQDPVQYPRTAATAYTMGPEAAPVLLDAERGTLQLIAFYHSHPKHGAYFSAEDRTQAMGGWDEPLYPDAAQLVLAVEAEGVGAMAAFRWDPQGQDYVEVSVKAA